MVQQAEVYLLIERLYDAALRPHRWRPVLQSLGDLVGADVGLAFCMDPATGATEFLQATEDNALLALLSERHMDNPWSRATRRNPEGTVARTERLVPLSELQESAFGQEILKPAGLLHSLGANLINEERRLGCFSFLRSPDGGEFPDDALDRVAAVVPHFARSMEVSLRLGEADLLGAAALETLHRLTTPLFLVDRSARVSFANQAAEELLRHAGSLSVHDGQLQVASPAASAALGETLVRATADTRGQRLPPSGAYVSVPSVHGGAPLILLVIPLGDLGRSSSSLSIVPARQPTAAVLAGGRVHLGEIAESALALAFGLTKAEARVARLVAGGAGVPMVAQQLQVSQNTVRTHLARIFEKTGTHRQVELMHVLLSTIPTLCRSPG